MDQKAVKDEILARIKAGKPESCPLPDVPMYAWPGDPTVNFIERLLGFDGRVVKFRNRAEAVKWLMDQPEFAGGKARIYSSAEGVSGTVSEEDVAELRNAHKINICVTEGELGVGETGSIWVTDKSLKHAACALLAPNLFILLDSKRIFGGLHEAYASIKLKDQQYGSFYSGPSATADIEAVHITGAQGPLSMTALIYDCADAQEPPQIQTNPNADKSIWTEVLQEKI